eukprot:1307655-Amphidinium_carterae.1
MKAVVNHSCGIRLLYPSALRVIDFLEQVALPILGCCTHLAQVVALICQLRLLSHLPGRFTHLRSQVALS